jgi:lysine 2,3-aminomutase
MPRNCSLFNKAARGQAQKNGYRHPWHDGFAGFFAAHLFAFPQRGTKRAGTPIGCSMLAACEQPFFFKEQVATIMSEQTDDSHMDSCERGAFASETEEPPGSERRFGGVRHPRWIDIADHLWNDWRWQQQNSIRSTSQLAELLPLEPDEIASLEKLETQYRMAIPPYYFSLIDPRDPVDPIRLQAVPSSAETHSASGAQLDDPLEEDLDSPVPGVTHRYPDRALLITTPVCTMYCRFCTRKRVTMDRDGWDAPSHSEQRMIQYIRETPAIHDVILSGGDPLTLPLAKLNWFVTQLAAIEHVDVIRVGTRVPVTLPQRLLDRKLIEVLSRAEKVWIHTHFNHPREVTPEAAFVCKSLVAAGMPVNNHTVLLKGVNDSVETMRSLMRQLLRIKVRPYYLFHCDPVVGAGHFRTSVWKGVEIIEGLRGHVSGLAVPTYVVDGLHGAGKIPLMPNYLISASENAVVLRNYEGMIFRYQPEDKPTEDGSVPSQGVSALLSGGGEPLIPPETPRIKRRHKNMDKVSSVEELAGQLFDNGVYVGKISRR